MRSVAFSPDGKRLASGDWLWEAETGQELLSFNGRGTYSLVFSPDGHRLAITTLMVDRVTIWDATPLPEKP
jgi:WD40 repeat protein